MVIKANICTHLHFTDTRPVRQSTHVAHTRHVNPRCQRLRSLSEHCQNRWSERAAYFCHWLRETVQQKKMIGLWIRKAGGGENVARAKSVKVQNLEFSSLGNKMKRLLNHFIFLPHAFSLFFFHGHAHTDTHIYRHKENHVHVAAYIYKISQTAHENMCQWLKKIIREGQEMCWVDGCQDEFYATWTCLCFLVTG